jgi:hypothetical protein
VENFIVTEFYNEMQNVKFKPYGILDANDQIYTLGTDSKIIGRYFEMLVQPVLEKIAKKHNVQLKTPEKQTIYPDFIMMDNPESTEKIAIDVKSTYIKTDKTNIKFTLGSFCSYMRDNTKNIEYKYTDYVKHYVIGFTYKRKGAAQESRVYNYTDREQIKFPIYDIHYFIQEKYKIAGDKPGSYDTENIGSFPTKKFQDLKDGNGPFSILGKDVFEIYWKYYPQYRDVKQHNYKSLPEFVDWFLSQDETNIQLLHKYDYNATYKRISEYAQKLKSV